MTKHEAAQQRTTQHAPPEVEAAAKFGADRPNADGGKEPVSGPQEPPSPDTGESAEAAAGHVHGPLHPPPSLAGVDAGHSAETQALTSHAASAAAASAQRTSPPVSDESWADGFGWLHGEDPPPVPSAAPPAVPPQPSERQSALSGGPAAGRQAGRPGFSSKSSAGGDARGGPPAPPRGAVRRPVRQASVAGAVPQRGPAGGGASVACGVLAAGTSVRHRTRLLPHRVRAAPRRAVWAVCREVRHVGGREVCSVQHSPCDVPEGAAGDVAARA